MRHGISCQAGALTSTEQDRKAPGERRSRSQGNEMSTGLGRDMTALSHRTSSHLLYLTNRPAVYFLHYRTRTEKTSNGAIDEDKMQDVDKFLLQYMSS